MAEAANPKSAQESVGRVSLIRKTISSIGFLITLMALANLVFLIIIDQTSTHANPYLGILAWLVAPGILCFGILVILIGMLRERRLRRSVAPGETPQFPRIDFNVAR